MAFKEIKKAEVLHDNGIDAHDADLVHEFEQFVELFFENQGVEGEIDPAVSLVRQDDERAEVLKGDVFRPLPGVERRQTAIHRIRPGQYGGFDGVAVTAGGKKFRDFLRQVLFHGYWKNKLVTGGKDRGLLWKSRVVLESTLAIFHCSISGEDTLLTPDFLYYIDFRNINDAL